MEQQKRIRKFISEKINKDTVLLFDLDGTLVDTDFANFLAYKNAIRLVTNNADKIQFNPEERFNRKTLKAVLENLTDREYDRIVSEKENNFKDYLSETKLIDPVYEILIEYSETNRIALVTHCREDRALMILKYHRLTKKFDKIFNRQILDNENQVNKYKVALTLLQISAESVVVFENEMKEIEDAAFVGIPLNNILKFTK